MKEILCTLLIVFWVSASDAQMTSGLTGQIDTSFSNQTAFRSAKKKHPHIKLVTEQRLSDVAEKRGVTYCTYANRELKLDVFYPARKYRKPRPGVLIIHGGGWRSGNRAQHIPLAQQLASRGYVCFTVEYRLSTEALYPAAIFDLQAAIRWVRANAKKYHVNPSQIAAAGFSAGGELAAFLGVASDPGLGGESCNLSYSEKLQAVIDIDGTLSFVHPESGEGDDRRSVSAATYWFGYPKKEKPGLWTEASPLTHVSADSPPFLFLNSSVDRMHAGRDDFRKVLNSHNIYSEVYTFPDSPHTFCLFEPWFGPTVEHIDKFLNKVFK